MRNLSICSVKSCSRLIAQLSVTSRLVSLYVVGFVLAISAGFSVTALAQQSAFPDRPIRLIVPFSPGGTADILGRLLSQYLAPKYGQQVVVDNRPGAGGNIGADVVAKSAPDGYTLLLGTIGIHAAYSIYASLPYDPAKDLQPVILLGEMPNVLVVNPKFPVKNVKELIALAKKEPGEINFGSAGYGSSTHMIGELFKLKAGVNLTHVPYKGSAPAMQDLIGGRIQVMFENIAGALQYIHSGQIRALAVTSAKRSPSLPNVPTVAEAGVPGYSATAWFTVAAPAKVPAAIIGKLNKDINAALKSPQISKRLQTLGVSAIGGSPEQAAKFFASETVKWSHVIKTAGLKVK